MVFFLLLPPPGLPSHSDLTWWLPRSKTKPTYESQQAKWGAGFNMISLPISIWNQPKDRLIVMFNSAKKDIYFFLKIATFDWKSPLGSLSRYTLQISPPNSCVKAKWTPSCFIIVCYERYVHPILCRLAKRVCLFFSFPNFPDDNVHNRQTLSCSTDRVGVGQVKFAISIVCLSIGTQREIRNASQPFFFFFLPLPVTIDANLYLWNWWTAANLIPTFQEAPTEKYRA